MIRGLIVRNDETFWGYDGRLDFELSHLEK